MAPNIEALRLSASMQQVSTIDTWNPAKSRISSKILNGDRKLAPTLWKCQCKRLLFGTACQYMWPAIAAWISAWSRHIRPDRWDARPLLKWDPIAGWIRIHEQPSKPWTFLRWVWFGYLVFGSSGQFATYPLYSAHEFQANWQWQISTVIGMFHYSVLLELHKLSPEKPLFKLTLKWICVCKHSYRIV